MTTDELVARVAGVSAAFAELRAAHLADGGELLPHVFFGDVSRRAVELHERAVAGDPAADAELAAFLTVAERAVSEGDDGVLEVIGVSFLENVAWEMAHDPRLLARLGPRLREEAAPFLEAFGGL